jgi:hypothetical protein
VALPGAGDQPDYGNTADAVVALAAADQQQPAARAADWLARHAADWARQKGPAAYAQLIFAAHATGTDPHRFGGTDLVDALNATGPTPQATTGSKDTEGAHADGGSGGGAAAVWWVVGVCLVAGIGVGLLLSTRTRRRS